MIRNIDTVMKYSGYFVTLHSQVRSYKVNLIVLNVKIVQVLETGTQDMYWAILELFAFQYLLATEQCRAAMF